MHSEQLLTSAGRTLAIRVSFWLCVFGLAATFVVALALVIGQGDLSTVAIKILYNAVFFACPVILLLSLATPLFNRPVLATRMSQRAVFVLIVADVLILQLIAFVGLGSDANFQAIYLKHFILLQVINLLLAWACVCGVLGQESLPGFVRSFMRNPLGAIGYWLGYHFLRR